MNEKRSASGAYKPSPEEAKRLLGADGSESRRTSDAITWHDHTGKQLGVPERRKTAEEIRAEAKARVEADPNMRAYYARKREQQAEALGHRVDSVLLQAHQIINAVENDEL